MKIMVSISKADKDITKGDYYLVNVGTPKKPSVYVAEVIKVSGNKVSFRYNGTEARGKVIELGKGTSKILEKTRRKKSHKPLSPVQTEKLMSKIAGVLDTDTHTKKIIARKGIIKPPVDTPEATGMPVKLARNIKPEKVSIDVLNLTKAKRKKSQAFLTGKEFSVDEPASIFVKYQKMPYARWLSLIKGISSKAQLVTRKGRTASSVITHASVGKNVIGTYTHSKVSGTVIPMVRSKYDADGKYKDSRVVRYGSDATTRAPSAKETAENVPEAQTFVGTMEEVKKAIKQSHLGNSKIERTNLILSTRTSTRPDLLLDMFKGIGWTVIKEGSVDDGTISVLVKGNVKAAFNHGRQVRGKFVWDRTVRFEQI